MQSLANNMRHSRAAPPCRRQLFIWLLEPRRPPRRPGHHQQHRGLAEVSWKKPPSNRLITEAKEFARVFLAPYQLEKINQRLALRSRAFWALVGSGSVYGLCRFWEKHQATKSDSDSLYVPLLGSQTNCSRWSLAGPYLIVLFASSLVFTLWHLSGLASLKKATNGLVSLSVPGAEFFLRLFVDKAGLGQTIRAYSRPLVSPLGSTVSHRYVSHFLINQIVLFGALTACIGKMSPGEFVAFFVSSAYATSLVSFVAMCLTNRFVYCIGASGVLSALVAYNALTIDDNVRFWSQTVQETDIDQQPSLALFGLIPLRGLTPSVGLSVWAGLEAACWVFAVFRGRPPRLNHAGHLAGIGFGCLYAYWGHSALWSSVKVPPLRIKQN